MSKKVLVFMVLFSLSLIIGSLYIISIIDPGDKPKATAEKIEITPGTIVAKTPFHLHIANGKEFTLANLQNKFTVLYFGFTYCPDVCPSTLHKLKVVTSMLTPEQLAKIQFIFVSIDPFRDQDKELYYFVDEYGGKHMIGVNGTERELDKLAIDLNVYHAKEEGKEENYRIDHTSFVYLLNPKAELITQFTQEATMEVILEKLRSLDTAR